MPTLVIFAGLPGVGKTTIAQMLACELGAMYLRVDTIEQALREGGVEDVGGLGYMAAYALASENLRLGQSVVADTVNPWPLTRDAWRNAARKADCPFVDIEVICSDQEEHRRRVESRQPDIPGHRLPAWQEVVDRDYRPWDPADPVMRIDTATVSAETACRQIQAQVMK